MAKKIISLITLVLSPLMASAYDALVDGIYYNFLGEEATVTYYDANYNSYFGSVIIPETVICNNKTYSVTSIGPSAFRDCSGLTSVTIPNSVTSIGDYAFRNCSGLTTINIPNSVTSIGQSAFRDCSVLALITVGNSVTSIGGGAFYGTAWYNNQPEGLIYVGKVAYKYKGNMPDGTQITIEDGTLGIAGLAFQNYSGLTSITIPKSVTNIGSGAFMNCSGLTSITIPDNVTTIGQQAFDGCRLLVSVTIGKSMKDIGYLAFKNCTNLTKVIVSDITAWCGISFGHVSSNPLYYAHHLYINETIEVIDLVIPNEVTSIGDFAFEYCDNLTSVTIPNSVTNIGNYAFYYCSGLTSIVIPNNVTSIGNRAFEYCSGLTSVTIPESMTNIGEQAFYICKLRNVFVKCTTPPTASKPTFSEPTYYHTILYVPTNSWDAYAYDDNWFLFHNIRETATTEEQVSTRQAYTLMDANSFAYSVYDPVNNCIGTIGSVSGINEDNPNHSWQVIEAGGVRYLYNIGAKKYVRRNGNSFELTDVPESIEVEDGDNGIIIGAQPTQQWALVSNERMSVAQSAIDEVTAIVSPIGEKEEGAFYSLSGQRLNTPQKGFNIIDGKKVVIK